MFHGSVPIIIFNIVETVFRYNLSRLSIMLEIISVSLYNMELVVYYTTLSECNYSFNLAINNVLMHRLKHART